MGYAMPRKKTITIDTGHFHPTELIADKISSILLFSDKLSFHVSRGVRWDSDHVVILNDETIAIGQELVRGDFLPRTHIGLDYFDASINRVAAWVIGMRDFQKALLRGMLEPLAKWKQLELDFDFTSRLALLEEAKSLPWQAVWDQFCLIHNAPIGSAWLDKVKAYEKNEMQGRD
ncbi:MAG: L-rhamnose isomerase, partial [Planctomycetes bacterium]|nr:L-rhamnose isomerase [Planctomycetota bacterium]